MVNIIVPWGSRNSTLLVYLDNFSDHHQHHHHHHHLRGPSIVNRRRLASRFLLSPPPPLFFFHLTGKGGPGLGCVCDVYAVRDERGVQRVQ